MTILATIDRDPGCAQVVETAEELALGLGQDLVILHVMPESDDETIVQTEIEEIVAGSLSDDTEHEIRIVTQAAKRDAPTGRTAETIMRIADEVNPAYLVIGSRKRTPIGKVILGSVSQLVLANADVPVVTVEQTT